MLTKLLNMFGRREKFEVFKDVFFSNNFNLKANTVLNKKSVGTVKCLRFKSYFYFSFYAMVSTNTKSSA